MSKSLEDLLDEIHQNARRDRGRLESYLDEVGKSAISDPDLAAALAGSVVEISEALTKNNAQLVELAKVRIKNETDLKKPEADDEFSDKDVEDAFDEIEDEFDNGSN